MQSPGTMSHQALYRTAAFSIASAMIRPQLYVSGGRNPRKARTLSDRIETATVRIVFAKIRGNAFGKTWRTRIRELGAPSIFARSTNIRSLIESTWLRITRAVTDQPVSPMTRIRPVRSTTPTFAATTIIRTSHGIERITSLKRMRTSSIQPPTYPEMSPTAVPTTVATTAEPMPTMNETWVPQITWE